MPVTYTEREKVRTFSLSICAAKQQLCILTIKYHAVLTDMFVCSKQVCVCVYMLPLYTLSVHSAVLLILLSQIVCVSLTGGCMYTGALVQPLVRLCPPELWQTVLMPFLLQGCYIVYTVSRPSVSTCRLYMESQ